MVIFVADPRRPEDGEDLSRFAVRVCLCRLGPEADVLHIERY